MLDFRSKPIACERLPLKSADPDLFGGKAKGLSEAAELNLRIARGFVISCEAIRSLVEHDDSVRKQIEHAVEELVGAASCDRIIVRSSHPDEAVAGRSSAGKYESYVTATCAEEVIRASIKVFEHAKAVSEKNSPQSCRSVMAIVVQEHIDAELFGVMSLSSSGVEAEVSAVNFDEVLKGTKKPKSVFRDWSLETFVDRSGRCDEVLNSLLTSLPFARLKSLIGCSIEFAIWNEQFIVLQLNYFNSELNGYEFTRVLSNEVFTKAQAMSMFRDTGLFSRPCLIIQSDIDFEAARKSLCDFWDFDEPLTIRVSEGSRIGLPRGFFDDLNSAVSFMKLYRGPQSTIIAHPFLTVSHSFEINVEEHSFVGEHVPGIWESDSKIVPDMFGGDDTGRCWMKQVVEDRVAKLAFPTGTEEVPVDPVSKLQVSAFCEMASEICAQVRKFCDIKLPVTVHAIWDEGDDSYQCLNLRPSTTVFTEGPQSEVFHEVAAIRDLETWDKASPVLLKMSVNRGNESAFSNIASTLSRADIAVYVEFGVLSHPAMVLRDHGCMVFPVHRTFDSQKRDLTMWLNLDVGDDAHSRILKETALIKDDRFHIVQDADPIGFEHLLFVFKGKSPSVCDADCTTAVVQLAASLGEPDSFFYERGRASFCSSGFTNPQAHFHIVSGLNTDETFRRMNNKLEGEIFDTLHKAYDTVGSIGEYCIFGSKNTGFAVHTGGVVGKRFFRSCAVRKQILV